MTESGKKTAILGKNLQETLDCRSATADHYWDTDLFSQLSGILFKRGVDMRYVDWTEERGEDKRRGWNERFYGNIKRFITKFNLLFISKNATVVGNCIPWSFWIIKSRDFHCERIAGLHCAADKCCILQQNCDQKNILRGWEKTGGEALEHSSSTLGITVTWYLITTTNHHQPFYNRTKIVDGWKVVNSMIDSAILGVTVRQLSSVICSEDVHYTQLMTTALWTELCYSQSSKVWYSNPSYTPLYYTLCAHCVCCGKKEMFSPLYS